MARVTVQVFLKPGVLDVQGKAVEAALHGLGWPAASDVRVGRTVSFDLPGIDPGEAETQARDMCARLLANPVIEGFRVEAE